MDQLREVEVKGHNRHGDLPTLEHFWMDLSDNTDGLSLNQNAPRPTFQK